MSIIRLLRDTFILLHDISKNNIAKLCHKKWYWKFTIFFLTLSLARNRFYKRQWMNCVNIKSGLWKVFLFSPPPPRCVFFLSLLFLANDIGLDVCAENPIFYSEVSACLPQLLTSYITHKRSSLKCIFYVVKGLENLSPANTHWIFHWSASWFFDGSCIHRLTVVSFLTHITHLHATHPTRSYLLFISLASLRQGEVEFLIHKIIHQRRKWSKDKDNLQPTTHHSIFLFLCVYTRRAHINKSPSVSLTRGSNWFCHMLLIIMHFIDETAAPDACYLYVEFLMREGEREKKRRKRRRRRLRWEEKEQKSVYRQRRVSIEYHERFMQKILRFNRNITRYIYFDEFVNAAFVKAEIVRRWWWRRRSVGENRFWEISIHTTYVCYALNFMVALEKIDKC
jgi:hypothetical protein